MGDSLLKSRMNARASATSGQKERKENNTTDAPQAKTPDTETNTVSASSKLQKLKNKNFESLRSEEDIRKEQEQIEEEMAQQELLNIRKEKRRKERAVKTNRIITILLVIGCVYLVFLIYGAINTDYVYNASGQVIPQSMNMTLLKAKKEFESVSMQYLQARNVYESVLLLDYRMGAGQEDPLFLATEYEKVLEKVNSLTLQLDALQQSVPAEYIQVINMLTAWTGTDIAVYCQNMSAAIAQNNETYAANALQYKDIVYNDFSLITKNIATLGSSVEGCEGVVADIANWSPEKYIQEKVGYIGDAK